MSIRTNINQILSLSPRRSGKSYTLIQGCLATGATLVVHNGAYASQLKQKFPQLEVVTLDDADNLKGLNKNIVADHYVYELRELEQEREINRLLELLHKKKEREG